jgi:hypothetical protein
MKKFLIGQTVYAFAKRVSVVSSDGRSAVKPERAYELVRDAGYLILARSVLGSVVAIQRPEKPYRSDASRTTTTEMIFGRRIPVHHHRCLLWV